MSILRSSFAFLCTCCIVFSFVSSEVSAVPRHIGHPPFFPHQPQPTGVPNGPLPPPFMPPPFLPPHLSQQQPNNMNGAEPTEHEQSNQHKMVRNIPHFRLFGQAPPPPPPPADDNNDDQTPQHRGGHHHRRGDGEGPYPPPPPPPPFPGHDGGDPINSATSSSSSSSHSYDSYNENTLYLGPGGLPEFRHHASKHTLKFSLAAVIICGVFLLIGLLYHWCSKKKITQQSSPTQSQNQSRVMINGVLHVSSDSVSVPLDESSSSAPASTTVHWSSKRWVRWFSLLLQFGITSLLIIGLAHEMWSIEWKSAHNAGGTQTHMGKDRSFIAYGGIGSQIHTSTYDNTTASYSTEHSWHSYVCHKSNFPKYACLSVKISGIMMMTFLIPAAICSIIVLIHFILFQIRKNRIIHSSVYKLTCIIMNIQFFSILIWGLGGHLTLAKGGVHHGHFTLGPSWALLVASFILSFYIFFFYKRTLQHYKPTTNANNNVIVQQTISYQPLESPVAMPYTVQSSNNSNGAVVMQMQPVVATVISAPPSNANMYQAVPVATSVAPSAPPAHYQFVPTPAYNPQQYQVQPQPQYQAVPMVPMQAVAVPVPVAVESQYVPPAPRQQQQQQQTALYPTITHSGYTRM